MIHRRVERLDTAAATRTAADDAIADEAALVLAARGQPIATIMRSPGHDLELVRGLLLAEVGPRSLTWPLAAVGPDRVEIDAEPDELPSRAVLASAACGVCGRIELAALEGRARPVAADWQIAAAIVAAIPEAVRAHQDGFAATGGVHAAALCDRAGQVLAVREDVGRHNAVDKLIGASAAELPLGERLLALSGRAGYELLEKAVLAGVPIVVAVSAPSRLAIDVAERFRVTLCGFVRGGRVNVYSHGWRIAQ
ncbi:MAG: formate dehydrogenase accessory sulfurtransferase FdhD [Kofleriaceae bacterium]|nr:formate dehydrogenase accessory sulfurtransferase FdhD [Kofleriaceae bacterium]MBP9171909.1 formate dehydrogenase accessory sulfurtransferase FdhD [Kofleriaceae bacterium]MBP9859283.1 formate dehydrogenase accessory sulfurtransferase FdhD [Kofleriaceae bacterium]